MQQRRLRLGDILDDYCPRERRITNHVVVAMIEDDVKQTRCSTCDAEHEYKQAKVPAPRRKKTGVLSHPVHEGAALVASSPLAPPDEDAVDDDVIDDVDPDLELVAEDAAADSLEADSDADGPESDDADDIGNRVEDDGPVHRRLIRATLPRPEGHVPERKEPDFTMRQPTGRDFNGNGNRNGHRSRGPRGPRQAQGQPGGGSNTRFGSGQRHGAPQGQGGQREGNRQGQPSSHRGGGRPGGGGAGQNRGNNRKRGR